MSKRTLIILIISTIVIAGLVVGALLFIKGNPGHDNAQTPIVKQPRPGDILSTDDTPKYKACTIVDTAKITAAFDLDATKFVDGVSSGVVAVNGEKAQECTYGFSTSKSDKNTLRIVAYSVSAKAGNDAQELDGEWENINDISYGSLGYLSTYYRMYTDGDQSLFHLRVDDGGMNYSFIIVQPKESTTLDKARGKAILLEIALASDYRQN